MTVIRTPEDALLWAARSRVAAWAEEDRPTRLRGAEAPLLARVEAAERLETARAAYRSALADARAAGGRISSPEILP